MMGKGAGKLKCNYFITNRESVVYFHILAYDC